jgi:N4-(beta-N-acetylglucosaminyl)-L-asparaginase
LQNVTPDPTTSCGPYSPSPLHRRTSIRDTGYGESGNHDTIGMVAIDADGHVVAGTSTNGATHKIPG